MLYGPIVGEAAYKVVDVMKLPRNIQDAICESCSGNDTATIINPEYYPKLKEWLAENGHSDTDCYIAWWSW